MPEKIKFTADEDIINFFHEGQLYYFLDKDEVRKLFNIIKAIKFFPGEYVFKENDNSHFLYLVKEGELVYERNGKTLKKLLPGDTFGEVSFIDEGIRTSSVKAVKESMLYYLNGDDLLDGNKIPPEISLKIVMKLAQKVTEQIRSIEKTTTKKLIEAGESDYVEFKSTLRWNLHTDKRDKEIEHASLKTIAAFLNSEGGTLLIGVDDGQNVLGIEKDGFANDDKAMLHLTNLIKERMGKSVLSFVDIAVEELEGKKIMRVDCKPASTPVYLVHNNTESFFIRTGPSTTALPASEIFPYILNRFYLPLIQAEY